jgi:hypothetical protein
MFMPRLLKMLITMVFGVDLPACSSPRKVRGNNSHQVTYARGTKNS